ncbi:MAG: hypothetical protein ACKOBY_01180 [Cyanobium sp.]
MRKQRSWNLLAIVSVLLAGILALLAITRIDVRPVQTRDVLRLSTAPRALTIDPRQLPPQRLEHPARRTARCRRDPGRSGGPGGGALPGAGGHLRNTASELDLSVPSYAGSGYVWMIWSEPLQRYLEAAGITIDQRFTLLNTLFEGS